MKLANYTPTSRNILFQDVREEKVGSILIPAKGTTFSIPIGFDNSQVETKAWSSDDSSFKKYKAIKTGKDCSEIKSGDILVLLPGIRPTPLELDGESYWIVPEIQVIGYERG
jgi:hypothetical protein